MFFLRHFPIPQRCADLSESIEANRTMQAIRFDKSRTLLFFVDLQPDFMPGVALSWEKPASSFRVHVVWDLTRSVFPTPMIVSGRICAAVVLKSSHRISYTSKLG